MKNSEMNLSEEGKKYRKKKKKKKKIKPVT